MTFILFLYGNIVAGCQIADKGVARSGCENSDRRVRGNSAQMRERNAHIRSREDDTYLKESTAAFEAKGALAAIWGAFVDWRYIHEKEDWMEIDYTFLMQLAQVVQDVARDAVDFAGD